MLKCSLKPAFSLTPVTAKNVTKEILSDNLLLRVCVDLGKPGKRQRAEKKQAGDEDGKPQKRRKSTSDEDQISPEKADQSASKYWSSPAKSKKAGKPGGDAPAKANRKERREVKFARKKAAQQAGVLPKEKPKTPKSDQKAGPKIGKKKAKALAQGGMKKQKGRK